MDFLSWISGVEGQCVGHCIGRVRFELNDKQHEFIHKKTNMCIDGPFKLNYKDILLPMNNFFISVFSLLSISNTVT